VKAWARADEEDQLQRAELWSHGKAVATMVFESKVGHAGHVFPWKPEGEWDWAAIRLVTKRGWALTSAFYAAGPTWRAPEPVQCRLTVSATGLSADELKETLIEVWEVAPDLAPARRLSQQPFRSGEMLLVPVGGSVVVVAPKARRKTISVYDAVGMPKFVERIASGVQRERPLLDWKIYEEALSHCREAKVELAF
jgi:hypothetical protein